MRRRRLLRTSAAAAVGVGAGCLGGNGDEPGGGGSGNDAGESGSGAGGSAGDEDDDGNGAGDGSDGASPDAAADGAADWPSGPYADYESTRVTVEDEDGSVLGTVTAAIAATGEDRYRGLSDAESLPADAGMLFVYDAPRESLTYVMRRMSFGIDIVYVDGDRTITRIHHAPAPGPNEDGNEQRYPGSGQFVLEVPYEWTDRNGVEVGDSLAFEV